MRRFVKSLSAKSMIAAVLVPLAAAGCQEATASSSGNVAHPALAAQSRAVRQCAASVLVLRPGPFVSPMTGEHADSFMLTNHGSVACTVSGYPQVTLYDSRGMAVPFRYARGGGAYVTAKRPATVTLTPGKSAYVLVAKYRCDLGIADDATAIRLTLREPHGPALSGREPIGRGAAGLSYCKGGPKDPGQLVTVSPIEATVRATTSLPLDQAATAAMEEHYVWMTTRRIKPGTLTDFDRAWRPDRHPEGMQRAYAYRSEDEQQIIGVSFWAAKESCDAWRASEAEARRPEAMAPRVLDEQEAFYRGRELVIPAP